MNSMLRVLVRQQKQYNQLNHFEYDKLNLNKSSLGFIRCIFDEKYLKIDQFRNDQKLVQKYLNTKETIKNNVTYQIETVSNLNMSNLHKLLRLTTDKKDIEFLIDKLRKIIQENVLSPNEIRGLVVQLLRAMYIHNETDLATSLLDDFDFAPYIKGSYSSLIIMNKLLTEKRFEEVVQLFEKQLPEYSINISFSNQAVTDFKQNIPYDQLDCVAEALLNIVILNKPTRLPRSLMHSPKLETRLPIFNENTHECVEKVKTLLEILAEKNSNLGRRAVARLFLLCINHNEPELALSLVHRFAFSLDLRLNLEVIALCRMNKLSSAFVMANEMFKIYSEERLKYTGKFFNLTIKSLEEAVERSEENEDYKKILDNLKKLIQNRKRMSKFDLTDYCSNY